MELDTEDRRIGNGTLLAGAILGLGTTQALLVALALARILPPDWATFTPVGILSGLGMAAVSLAIVRRIRALHSPAERLTWLGVVSGVGVALTWVSVLGGALLTNDLVRIGVVLLCNIGFAVALVASSRYVGVHSALPGLGAVATLMGVLAVVQLALAALVLLQTGAGAPNVPVIVLSVSVLVVWIVLAAWEIVVGVALIRRARQIGC